MARYSSRVQNARRSGIDCNAPTVPTVDDDDHDCVQGVRFAVQPRPTTRLAPESGRGRAPGASTALSNVDTGAGSALGGVVAASLGYVATFVGGSLLVPLGATTLLEAADASGADG